MKDKKNAVRKSFDITNKGGIIDKSSIKRPPDPKGSQSIKNQEKETKPELQNVTYSTPTQYYETLMMTFFDYTKDVKDETQKQLVLADLLEYIIFIETSITFSLKVYNNKPSQKEILSNYRDYVSKVYADSSGSVKRKNDSVDGYLSYINNRNK